MTSVTRFADDEGPATPSAFPEPKNDLTFLFHPRSDGIGQNAWKVGKSNPRWALPSEESAGPPGVGFTRGPFPPDTPILAKTQQKMIVKPSAMIVDPLPEGVYSLSAMMIWKEVQ